MRRTAVVLVALASLVALPVLSVAKPRSFHSWAVRWNAKATRDNARVLDRCQRLHGSSDLEFGMCFVDAGRANLRAERVIWEKQLAAVTRGQAGRCKSAIRPSVDGVRHRLHVSVAEVDHQDQWQRSGIGVAAVSGTAGHLRDVLDSVERFVDHAPDVEVLDVETTFMESE